MEEGPEPHEWVERTAEEHHKSESHEEPPGRMVPAITAAVLAVFAAFGSLLSGHAANEAILAQNKATDQWAFYQAKSTKEQIFDVGGQVVNALTEGTAQAERTKAALERFRGEVHRYEREKEEIKREAEKLEEESRHEYQKHTRYALGIVFFQVGIVLASVSLLVRFRWLHVLSLVTGVVGLLCLIVGLLSYARSVWCPATSAGLASGPGSSPTVPDVVTRDSGAQKAGQAQKAGHGAFPGHKKQRAQKGDITLFRLVSHPAEPGRNRFGESRTWRDIEHIWTCRALKATHENALCPPFPLERQGRTHPEQGLAGDDRGRGQEIDALHPPSDIGRADQDVHVGDRKDLKDHEMEGGDGPDPARSAVLNFTDLGIRGPGRAEGVEWSRGAVERRTRPSARARTGRRRACGGGRHGVVVPVEGGATSAPSLGEGEVAVGWGQVPCRARSRPAGRTISGMGVEAPGRCASEPSRREVAPFLLRRTTRCHEFASRKPRPIGHR